MSREFWLIAKQVLALAAPTAANATSYQCGEFGYGGIRRPEKPICVTIQFQGNESAFQVCKSEMERYQSAVQQYLNCLQAESNEAAGDYNSTVRSFNCNAQGSFC
jgi:hypothetical protein